MAFTPTSSLAPAAVAIIGPVSVTQGTSPWVVDGSAVTQPVSFAQPVEVTDADAALALADVGDTLTELLATETGQAALLALLVGAAIDADTSGLLVTDAS